MDGVTARFTDDIADDENVHSKPQLTTKGTKKILEPLFNGCLNLFTRKTEVIYTIKPKAFQRVMLDFVVLGALGVLLVRSGFTVGKALFAQERLHGEIL